MNSRHPKRVAWACLGGLLLAALLARAGILMLQPHGLARDTDSYRAIAETLRSTGTFGYRDPRPRTGDGVVATAFRPPLFPLLLAPLVTDGHLSPAVVGAFNLACGLLTVAMVWVVGRQWGLGQRGAVVAAAITAGDPILVNQSAQLMTETLATLMALIALWGVTRCAQRPTASSGLLAGVLLGLASLCRPTFLPWSGLVAVALWLHTRANRTGNQRASPSRWPAAALVIGVTLTILPWGARNFLQWGRWKFTTTHGGYTLLLGNNPAYYRFLRVGGARRTWDSDELRQAWIARARVRDANDDLFAQPAPHANQSTRNGQPDLATRSEFEDDQLAYAYAIRFIREEPEMFLRACLYRVRSLWRIVPLQANASESTSQQILRWCSGAWYAVLLAAALVGILSLRLRILRSPWIWGVLLCATFTAVHALYWSDMRMRAPLMPFIALLAAARVGIRLPTRPSRGNRAVENTGA